MSGFRSIVIVSAVLAAGALASAQESSTISRYDANTYSPYGWNANGTSRFGGDSELLGGPVRQPGEIQVGSDREYAVSADRYTPAAQPASQNLNAQPAASSGPQNTDVRVILTDAYRASIEQQQSYVKPGTQVESVNGLPMGTVQRVDRDNAGQVT